ncbi:MAG: hypothetical protein ACE5EO_03210 [Candidatus Krumholzibacteriia bacterium]
MAPRQRQDSVFRFSADVVADSSIIGSGDLDAFEFVRPHTFFVRAVDDRGARSKAIYRSFTARNLSPLVTILTPPSIGLTLALVPPIPTFQWVAADFIGSKSQTQDPDSTRSILVSTSLFGANWDKTMDYVRDNPGAPEWTRWAAYDAPGDSGRFWHPEKPLAFGSYLFAVQVKDEAGAVTPTFDPDRNVKRIRVLNRATGPVLILSNKFMRDFVTSSPNPPIAIMDLPAGIPLSFSWTADASGYGGTVTEYRYGWDMLDLNDDSQWDIDFTPFIGSMARAPTRTWFFGTHTFFVEVVDNSGFKSRAGVTVNIVPFTMERDLLLVDDWDEGTSLGFLRTKGALPNDTEHDNFWRDMLSDVGGFLPGVDVFPAKGPMRPIPIGVISHYKTVIWSARGTPIAQTGAILNDMVKFGSDEINVLSLFMEAGGKVLVCGSNVMTNAINKNLFPHQGSIRGKGPAYPFIFRYESAGNQGSSTSDPVGETTFGYRDFCLNVLDTGYGVSARRGGLFGVSCGVTDFRRYDGKTEGLRAAVPIDATYSFPRLELRPEVSAFGKFLYVEQLGLNIDVYNPVYFDLACSRAELSPRRSCFEPMYALECLDETSGIFGEPVAYWTSRFADIPNPDGLTARSAVWGFEPVYFNPPQIKEALAIILFDEWQLPRK